MKFPFCKVGTHWRVIVRELMKYQEVDADRGKARHERTGQPEDSLTVVGFTALGASRAAFARPMDGD